MFKAKESLDSNRLAAEPTHELQTVTTQQEEFIMFTSKTSKTV